MGGALQRKIKRDNRGSRKRDGRRERAPVQPIRAAGTNKKRKRDQLAGDTQGSGGGTKQSNEEFTSGTGRGHPTLDEGVRTSGFACVCDANPCYCGAADEVQVEVPIKRPRPDFKACYNCGEAGHLSADCPNPRSQSKFKGIGRAGKMCYKCQQVGHMSFECNSR